MFIRQHNLLLSLPTLGVLLISVEGCQSSRNNAYKSPITVSKVAFTDIVNHSVIEEVSKDHSVTKTERSLPIPALPDQDIQSVSFETNSAKPLDLETINQLALSHSPVIREAEAAVSKSAGYRNQVGLYPNPIIGYNGTQLADKGTDQHTVFVQQDIVTGQKLEKNVKVLCHEVENLKWQAEQQRRTVLADVRKAYFEVLGAQEQLELTSKHVEMAKKFVIISQDNNKIGMGSNIDILQSKVQLQEVQISYKQSEANLSGAWKQLTANIGVPQMQPTLVLGELPSTTMNYNWNDEYTRIISQSPEIMAAQSRIGRALALLDRQRAQTNPNLSVNLAAGYDRGTDSQLINTQLGIPLMVNNQNQGNISAAYAEYCRSSHELKRLELSLKSRLATAAKDYEGSSATLNLYRDEVLPDTLRLMDIAEKAYKIGEVSYLQLFTIQQTYFNASLTYNSARTSVAKTQVSIEEMLLSGSLEQAPNTELDDTLRSNSLTGE